MSGACPNCGEPVDDVVAPGEQHTIEGYDTICVIGTGIASNLAGHRVIHQ